MTTKTDNWKHCAANIWIKRDNKCLRWQTKINIPYNRIVNDDDDDYIRMVTIFFFAGTTMMKKKYSKKKKKTMKSFGRKPHVLYSKIFVVQNNLLIKYKDLLLWMMWICFKNEKEKKNEFFLDLRCYHHHHHYHWNDNDNQW